VITSLLLINSQDSAGYRFALGTRRVRLSALLGQARQAVRDGRDFRTMQMFSRTVHLEIHQAKPISLIGQEAIDELWRNLWRPRAHPISYALVLQFLEKDVTIDKRTHIHIHGLAYDLDSLSQSPTVAYLPTFVHPA